MYRLNIQGLHYFLCNYMLLSTHNFVTLQLESTRFLERWCQSKTYTVIKSKRYHLRSNRREGSSVFVAGLPNTHEYYRSLHYL